MHLRGRENILKRVLIHLGGFNLSLVMRQLLGKGTPRGLQGASADALLAFLRFWIAVLAHRKGKRTVARGSFALRPEHRDSYLACRDVNQSLLPRAARALKVRTPASLSST